MRRTLALLLSAILLTTPVFASDAADSDMAASDTTSTEEESNKGLFGIFGDAVDFVSSKATEAGEAVQEAAGAAGDALGELGANISERTEKAATDLGELFDDWGQDISEAAGQISEHAASVSQDIAEKSKDIADQALSTLDGAANVVVNGAGDLINMAAETAGLVPSEAKQVVDTIAAQGSDLIAMADEAVAGLDLEKPENAAKAKDAINKAIEDAYHTGFFGDNFSPDALKIIKDIVSGITVYGYQYANGIITLPEYAVIMSRIIIRDGLPTGVGYLAGRLPIPGAGYIAKEVTELLIQAAYGTGEEEVLYEDVEQKGSQSTPDKEQAGTARK